MLTNMDRLHQAGGQAELHALMNETPTAANLEHYAEIVLQTSKKRRAMEIGRSLAQQAMRAETDPDDLLNETMGALHAVSAENERSSFERLGDHQIAEMATRLENMMQQGGTSGLASGFGDFDRLTGGFRDSEMAVVGGRPGMGKSSWALNIAVNLSLAHKIAVGVFSLEMSKANLTERLVAQVAGVDHTKIRDGHLNPMDYGKCISAMGQLGDAPIYIDDDPRLDSLAILSKARRMQHQVGIRFLIVDYLQLMTGRGGNREQEVASTAQACRRVARELDIPVLVVAQLSRAVELRKDKRPVLSDFRESGAIENEADLVVGLYREDYYEHSFTRIAEVGVLKHRNGPIGTVKLRFAEHLTQFTNLSQRSPGT
jgi:replicative DNA helicase